jgi:ERCC4-type nuclease
VLISPTEPPALKKIGEVSMLPERFGCDLLFSADAKWYGVQRKEFNDFLSSVRDGRIAEQLGKMTGVQQAMVVIEGAGRWTSAGQLIDRYHKITRDQVRKLLWSIRNTGVWVDWTDSLSDTIQMVGSFEEWIRKGEHHSMRTRPNPTSQWGEAGHRDWQIHFLQGLPGVGVKTAETIIDTLGMPVTWGVTVEELMTVPGIGRKTAERLWKAL